MEFKLCSISFETIKISEMHSKIMRTSFDEHQQKFIKGLKIVKIINNVDIYIAIAPIADIDLKNRLCLNLEIYLKKNLEESLIIYLETLWDKNKLRRLSL